MTEPRSTGAYERVFLGLAIGIAVIWAFATIVQIVYPGHAVPTYANLMMATVAGCFFGGAVIQGRRSGAHEKTVNDDPFDGPGGYYRANGEQ